ncbi:hypothetical protein CPB83DRAFT_360939 [Crepidotus variabilis]|uniref:Uncharacterized protein n=1 Tax=Crepidotus variabilis TaxID=179855 RepID=A0A9P6JQ24_9AGAR|nr:hypothetical protein CPB83DRAFT_360939 [Crepidotus variabilis]
MQLHFLFTMSIPEIEYALTRKIQWRLLAPISYAVAFIVIIFLTILNVALVGYETINVFQNDFNATQTLWFHGFLPYAKPKPGTLCDPHLFDVGDHFRTHKGFLDWTIRSIVEAGSDASTSGFPYKGGPLTNCELIKTMIDVDVTWGQVQESAIVLECGNLDGFTIQASASLTPFVAHTSTKVDNFLQSYDLAAIDARRYALRLLFLYALEDVKNRYHMANVTYHLESALTTPCSGVMAQTECGRKAPKFNGTVGYSWSLNPFPRVFVHALHDIDTPFWNLLQSVYAAVRVDLGINTLNNPLLHKEAIPMVIQEPKSALYNALTYNIKSPDSESLSDPHSIQAEYLCKNQQLKSTGSLIVSVLVAVISMFSGGWAVYLSIISTLAKRSPGANSCQAHHEVSYRKLRHYDIEKGDVEDIDSLETAVWKFPSDIDRVKRFDWARNGRRLYIGRRPSFVADEIVRVATSGESQSRRTSVDSSF